MADFLARALRYLGIQYQIRGSEVSTNQVDLSAVQLVQDVSSTLTAGRGFGSQDGWGVAQVAHVINDTASPESVSQVRGVDPYDPDNWWDQNQNTWPRNFPASEFDFWLYHVGLNWTEQIEGADVTNGRVWLECSALGFPFSRDGQSTSIQTRPSFFIGRFDSPSYDMDIGGGHHVQMPAGQFFFDAPLFVPRPSSSTARVLTTRVVVDTPGTDEGNPAATAIFQFLLRAVPRGLKP